MADKAKLDLGLLEEDDEFEEFPAESNTRFHFISLEISLYDSHHLFQ